MDQKERRPFREALEGVSKHASGAYARVRRRPLVVALCLLGACAAVIAVVFAVRGLPDWAFLNRFRGNQAGIQELKKRATEDPGSYERFRALGHAQFAAGHRMSALRSYQRALSISENAADETMLGNLALCFGLHEQAAAAQLINRHHLVAIAPRLEQLASSRSRGARWTAVATLEKLGRAGKIDYVHAYLVDLEAPACEIRQHAVEKLGDIGDRRVEPQLQAARKRDDDATPWYRWSCLGDRVEEATKKIDARAAKSEKSALAKK